MIDTKHFDVTEITPGFGAEVRGLTPGPFLEADEARELRALFDTYGVLVFRDIELDRPYQQYLAELVDGGEDLTEESVAANASRQDSFYISNKIEGAAAPYGMLLYHSDGMWSEWPFHVISLWGQEVAPPVPPTLFASTTRPLATMPNDLRRRIEGLEAVHVPGPESFAHRKLGDLGGTLVQPIRDQEYSVIQPIIYHHPRTGAEMLYASQQMTSHFVDMEPAASEALLDEVFAHLYAPGNTLHHEWRENDLVLWDNLLCQHARPDVEVEAATRTLRKVGWPLPPVPQTQNVLEYQRITN
jgi:taurine dioxygenase